MTTKNTASEAEQPRKDEIQAIIELARARAKTQISDANISGVVVGGDDSEMQVATRTGIVGVPVQQIKHIGYPIASRPDIVALFVEDLATTRSIFPVTPLWPKLPEPSPEIAEVITKASCSSSTAGAGESMTAGPVAGVSADDSEVHYSTDDCE